MNQNSIIAVSLIIGFVVFITIKGELKQYLAVIGLAGGAAGTPAPTGSGSTASTVTKVVTTVGGNIPGLT